MTIIDAKITTVSKTRKPYKKFTKVYKKDSLVIKRTIYSPITRTLTGFDESSNFYFQMSQVPNFAEFSAMFKQIKLNKVTVKWVPVVTQNNNSTVIKNLDMYTAINKDNFITGAPTSNSIREQSNCMIRSRNKGFTQTVYPVIKDQVGIAGATTYYTDIPCSKTWLSTSSGSIIYYGWDWFIADGGEATGTPLGNFIITYHIACRGPK